MLCTLLSLTHFVHSCLLEWAMVLCVIVVCPLSLLHSVLLYESTDVYFFVDGHL